MMKNKIVACMAILFVGSFAFAAGEFDQINNTISSASMAGKTSFGIGMQWFMSLFPLFLLIGTGVGGYKYAHKKAEQDQNAITTGVMTLIPAIIGFVAGLVIDALIGVALMGDGVKGIQVVQQFYRTALGV